ncbi:hypothetical protein H6G76_08430 [Nostoc sp. FACHB-152]|uniref:hypothetical protein n=1 Tax=unclassified Nostoc TaxID=2593658 RepID=UPI001683197D|nr:MULTISPECIES: hypothetical protein [unclassified Nostoc]MBD2447191.1 hypothetical protein [Nostoc sp. FACHB-152]MBD2469131.1 hypothetical protein [Nostoc sp. FACHB-145]
MKPILVNLPKKTTSDILQSIRHIDHITYVAPFEDEHRFLSKWSLLGFNEHMRLKTVRFPATHIALVSGISADYPWATMTGLSVSEDPNSPINKFIDLYGEGMQHTAYNIDPEADMEELHHHMKELGWKFMTPVLSYSDESGALLKQMFVAPSTPYGSFIEFVQRLHGADGKAFNSFDINNIDDLYEHYADYSNWLAEKI